MCYGHGQKAKITALSFQPRGHLLATGGDDCQVLVFDSKTFTSGRVVGGLVDSIVSGKLTQRTSDSAITSLAWHPSGFILAGTTDGLLDAFEIPGAIYETPKATNGHRDLPFLIKRNDDTRKGPAGWGGQPLDPIKNGNGDIDKVIKTLFENQNNILGQSPSWPRRLWNFQWKSNARWTCKSLHGKLQTESKTILRGSLYLSAFFMQMRDDRRYL